MIVSTAIEVLPVWRSPIISSRCPLPTGIIASIAVIPVCIGSYTERRATIPGAGDSIKRVSPVLMSPLPSIARPRASTTRPTKASPTGTWAILPVAVTELPS